MEEHFRDRADISWFSPRGLVERYSQRTVMEMDEQVRVGASLIRQYCGSRPQVLVGGYGYGRDAQIIRHNIPEVDITALDINLNVLTQPGIRFDKPVQARIQGIPYGNDYFDAVTCLETLFHVSDPFKAVREMLRVVKKDGVVIFNLSAIDSPVALKLVWSLFKTEGAVRLLGKLLPSRNHPVVRTKVHSYDEITERIREVEEGKILVEDRYLANRTLFIAMQKL